MLDAVQIALLIIGAFAGGAWLGSLVYRRQVNELLSIAKDMLELFGGGRQGQENIEAVVDFSTANLIWHFSPDGSDMEEKAMEAISKSLSRMDEDLRHFVLEQMQESKEIIAAANEKAEESNGAGSEHH